MLCNLLFCYQPGSTNAIRCISYVQAVTLDVEDLEADATPEDLMLSYVSGEKGKVRLKAMGSL